MSKRTSSELELLTRQLELLTDRDFELLPEIEPNLANDLDMDLLELTDLGGLNDE
jgi:hypothetical protein